MEWGAQSRRVFVTTGVSTGVASFNGDLLIGIFLDRVYSEWENNMNMCIILGSNLLCPLSFFVQ